MSQLGLGVMIKMIGGNANSVDAFTKAVGKTISELELGDDDALHFTFSDGYKMRLADEGQSCCESRYMQTDDDLSYFIGATLVSAEVKDAPDADYGTGDVHEVQFLEVLTSKGSFVMSSHNEHNGYYGGFAVRATEE